MYLEIIHELIHVKQHKDGVELHDLRFRYSDRPTEIEAFSYLVKEAKRVGITEEEVFDHLKTEWMSTNDVKRLAGT